MRLFLAVRFSDEVQKALLAAMHDLKAAGVRGSYVPGQNLHMTLCFIGETKERAAVCAAMDAVSFSPFRLSLDGIGAFGDLIWVGVKGNQALKGVVRDLRAQLDAAGIPYDKKEFKPHVTVIRRASGPLPKQLSLKKAEMMVRKISLMKSETRDGKTVYTEICSREAGKAPAGS